jgi:hypothetical protein
MPHSDTGASVTPQLDFPPRDGTGVTAGALPGQLAASSPDGLAAANDLTIPIDHRLARATSASRRSAFLHSRVEWSNVVPAAAAVVEAAISTCTPAAVAVVGVASGRAVATTAAL